MIDGVGSTGFDKSENPPNGNFGDRSSPFYSIKSPPLKKGNPLRGSVGIVQVPVVMGATIKKVHQQNK